LLVCCNLIEKGFEVFRAVSASCSCDLIALKNKISYRVEVTKRTRVKENKIAFPKHKNTNYDVIAVFFSDKTIECIGNPVFS